MASLPTNINCQPICQNCSTSTTPLWRRDENGSVLCNACGLFLKLHGRPRPISLKTDVIKSRNRVKTTGRGGVKKVGSLQVRHSFYALLSWEAVGKILALFFEIARILSPSSSSQKWYTANSGSKTYVATV